MTYIHDQASLLAVSMLALCPCTDVNAAFKAKFVCNSSKHLIYNTTTTCVK